MKKASTHHTEATQRLKRAKAWALALLLLVTTLFVTSLFVGQNTLLWFYIRSFSEAAMVGALADWFAVVALFRHPLGLPFPHTAILPNNQARLADELGHFIENNFLKSKNIALRVYQERPISYLLNCLVQTHQDMLHITTIRQYLCRFLAHIPTQTLSNTLIKYLKHAPSGRITTQTLALIWREVDKKGGSDSLIDHIILILRHHLKQENTQNYVKSRLNEWVGKTKSENPSTWDKFLSKLKLNCLDTVDDWLLEKTILCLDDFLKDISRDKNHVLREKWHEIAQEWQEKLHDDVELQERWGCFIQEWLATDDAHIIFNQKIEQLQSAIQKESELKHSDWDPVLTRLIDSVLRHLQQEPELLCKIERSFAMWLKNTITQNKHSVNHYIATRVKEWQTHTLVSKLELSVGKDLQYIRINGTLVGGLIGLILGMLIQYSNTL